MTNQAERIRTLNDALRMHGSGGRLVLTSGIATLPPQELNAVLLGVRSFTGFDPDNDPRGEHDCALLTVAGQRIMFKIDYYDASMTYGSNDPADPKQTCRVLTIMLAWEY